MKRTLASDLRWLSRNELVHLLLAAVTLGLLVGLLIGLSTDVIGDPR